MILTTGFPESLIWIIDKFICFDKTKVIYGAQCGNDATNSDVSFYTESSIVDVTWWMLVCGKHVVTSIFHFSNLTTRFMITDAFHTHLLFAKTTIICCIPWNKMFEGYVYHSPYWFVWYHNSSCVTSIYTRCVLQTMFQTHCAREVPPVSVSTGPPCQHLCRENQQHTCTRTHTPCPTPSM